MNKILLIIKREYLTRVKNKTFILTTILMPVFFVALIAGTAYFGSQGKSERKVAVVDNTGFFKANLKGTKNIIFEFAQGIDSLNYEKKGYTDVLYIPEIPDNAKETNFVIRSTKALGPVNSNIIENRINTAIEDKRLSDKGIKKTELDSIRNQSQIAQLKTEDKTGEKNQGLAYGIGYFCGILIYITMLIYGMMVMRGVMEEKTNRIAEVIVSSVKPFQLMMGKIIGIGAVGLTQFALWAILVGVLIVVAPSLVPPDKMQQIEGVKQLFTTANWPVIISCFIFYFLGGYLFYASLFAAIGSVVDDPQNANSLTLPITMPIIFSFVIMTTSIQNPDSPLAIWASIIPFSSPIVMMSRIAFGVPETVTYIQLISSVLALIAGFLFTTWAAGKIYRTGILLYGKKPSWKQMAKWTFRKA